MTTTTTNEPKPQTFQGTVVKLSSKDTVVISVSRYVKHPKYKKYQIHRKKYLVHDPNSIAKIGETVTIVACKPISKMKHFILTK